MKATIFLLPPYGRTVINPDQLKLRIATPAKRVAEEIGIRKLLLVIAGLAISIGLLVFLGVKLL